MVSLWTRKIVFTLIFLICFFSNGLASLYFGYVVNKETVVKNFISRSKQSTVLVRKSLQEGDYRTYVFYTKKFFSTVGEDVGIRLYSTLENSEIFSIDMDNVGLCTFSTSEKFKESGKYYEYCQSLEGLVVQIIQKKRPIQFFYVDKLHLSVSLATALLCCLLLILLMRNYFSFLLEKIESFLNSPKTERLANDMNWLRAPILKIYSAIDSLKDKLVEKEKAELLAKNVRQVTHDLGGPISALGILSDKLASEESNLAPLSKSALSRLKALVDDLRTKSKVGTQKLESFDIQKLFQDITKDMKLQHESISIFEKSDLSESIPVYGNKKIFFRVISCLVQNSVEAKNSNRDLKIDLSLSESDLFVYFQIKDNGTGIKESELGQVVLPGVSIGKENLQRSGMGLGLSFAFDKMEEWGGSAQISSIYGEGTEIKLALLKASKD